MVSQPLSIIGHLIAVHYLYSSCRLHSLLQARVPPARRTAFMLPTANRDGLFCLFSLLLMQSLLILLSKHKSRVKLKLSWNALFRTTSILASEFLRSRHCRLSLQPVRRCGTHRRDIYAILSRQSTSYHRLWTYHDSTVLSRAQYMF